MFISSLLALSYLAPNSTPILYRAGESVKDQAIKLGNWGSGLAKATDETAFEGVESIRITSRNYFQGGQLSLGRPVDLSAAYVDKANLLRVVFRMVDNTLVIGGAPGQRPPGAGGRGPGGGGAGAGGNDIGLTALNVSPGFGLFTGFGAQVGGKFGRTQGSQAPQPGQGEGTPEVAAFNNLRLILTTTDGLRSEAYLPAALANAKERGWREIAIPLQGISGFARTNKIVSQIGFSVDRLATFFVGDVRIVNDNTPIKGETNYLDPINVANGDEVTFKASGYGGATILRVVWDFDESDGIQEEAEGWQIRRRFRKPGKYIVTCTFLDKYGLKPSYSSKVSVTVNP